MLLVVLILCVLPSGLAGSQVDLTVQPEGKGQAVVDAVVDLVRSKCIFPDDRLFLRRLAYVESTDGQDNDTYRQNYHGGIWQIDKKLFESTKTTSSLSKLTNETEAILDNFGISWNETSWSDLRKPLISGLAASIVLAVKSTSVPGNVKEQAELWEKLYRPGGNKTTFIDKVDSMPKESCNKPVDLMFVVDESGSVGNSNFQKMKSFLVKVVDEINVSPNSFQVGMAKFQNAATVVFNIGSHSNKQGLKNAISKVTYRGGGTTIAAGIEKARLMFALSSRDEATRVILLLTDGQSNLLTTTSASENARADGVVIFALGIGGYKIEELNAAANVPDCTHMFLLQNFNEIDSILHQIRKSACTVAKIVSTQPGVTNETVIKGDLIQNVTLENTLEIRPGNSNVTGIKTEVECGTINIYASAETTRPNEAFYTVKGEATSDNPSAISVTNNGKAVYVTYKGRSLTDCGSGHFNITVTDGPPSPNTTPLSNPCTEESIAKGIFYHKHPLSKKKFIQCNEWGDMWEMPCAPGTEFDPAILVCNWPKPG